ncbi:CAP domain-containing protein [Mariannaea sp. PMI_226]|nr:CAP domain-containing protein [Mariannaea sp. PMI_226]
MTGKRSPDVITHVVTVTVGPAIPSSKPQWKQDSSFTSAILSTTNSYRAQHNATALTWNSTLEDFASDYLDSNDCVFKHSGGPYGENLAIGYVNATASVRAWGDEREEYNFHAGKFSEKTGHFTQLVWKDTTDVGCGRRLCGSRGWYLVCEYWPRGNVVGAFKAEVQSQTGDGGGGLARPPKVGALAVVVTGLVLFAGWL